MSLAQGSANLRAVPYATGVVRTHGPKPAHRARRHSHPKLSQIALKERADEVLPPCGTYSFRASQERARKSAAQPQTIEIRAVELFNRESSHLDNGYPACQSFGTLAQ